MKRYELKNKEHQRALEEIIPGFAELLDDARRGTRALGGFVYPCIKFPFTDLEVVEAYNPKGWNKYPEVTPPSRVLMQVEGVNEGQLFHRAAIYSERGSWLEETGTFKLKISVQRFRPWDDEEKKQ